MAIGARIVNWVHAIFKVTETPAGTANVDLEDQPANQALAGPASGGPASPAFRALVEADMADKAHAARHAQGAADDLVEQILHMASARVGKHQTAVGYAYIYGNPTGSPIGGRLYLFPAYDYEGTLSYWRVHADEDDLRIDMDTAPWLKFLGGENIIDSYKTIQADTISEHTPAAGVTADGVAIKAHAGRHNEGGADEITIKGVFYVSFGSEPVDGQSYSP